MAFGSYNPLQSGSTDSVGNITVTCSALVSILVGYTVKVDGGLRSSFSPRYMASGANLLQYQLYLDSAHTTVWGDGTAGTSYKNDGYLLSVIAPVVRSYSVYGSIPGLQNVFAGVYGDTTTVLLTY